MKLYDGGRAPNPRRTRIFLAEKGIKLPLEQIDLGAMQQRSKDYAAINPMKRVPALVLDDGAVITESIAICRYFEALRPDPPLFGCSALEIAQIEMWNRRLELHLLFPVSHVFRNSHPAMKEMEVPQVPAWAEANKPRIREFPVSYTHLDVYKRQEHHRDAGAVDLRVHREAAAAAARELDGAALGGGTSRDEFGHQALRHVVQLEPIGVSEREGEHDGSPDQGRAQHVGETLSKQGRRGDREEHEPHDLGLERGLVVAADKLGEHAVIVLRRQRDERDRDNGQHDPQEGTHADRPSAQTGALSAGFAGAPARQLGHDAGALLRAQLQPARDLRERTGATDARAGDRIDDAHLDARALDRGLGHETGWQIRVADRTVIDVESAGQDTERLAQSQSRTRAEAATVRSRAGAAAYSTSRPPAGPPPRAASGGAGSVAPAPRAAPAPTSRVRTGR